MLLYARIATSVLFLASVTTLRDVRSAADQRAASRGRRVRSRMVYQCPSVFGSGVEASQASIASAPGAGLVTDSEGRMLGAAAARDHLVGMELPVPQRPAAPPPRVRHRRSNGGGTGLTPPPSLPASPRSPMPPASTPAGRPRTASGVVARGGGAFSADGMDARLLTVSTQHSAVEIINARFACCVHVRREAVHSPQSTVHSADMQCLVPCGSAGGC